MNPTIELFSFQGSLFGWRVQLALAIHNIDYISHYLDPSTGEHKQPNYLALNPRGKVPLLKHGEFFVRESIAILVYLDSLSPEWQLFGNTSQEQAIIWQQVCEIENIIVPLLLQLIPPIFFGGLAGKEEQVIENFQKLKGEFTILNDNVLADKNWLAGDKLSAADIAIYPIFKFVEKLAAQEEVSKLNIDILPIEQKYPKLGNLLQKIDEMPNVDSLYPPDWR
ncbi:glutathione S-transferase family protein [Hydrocoleum sp. CS-953]|uniref:glutathione S-transferase family protein n=1 Tax=Hydrocoleum sp. CS-953 TaxID=1671698 RepID=UPI000B9AED78|nr:glutathione S-transferase [Hydrocoleum sp. CS-953]